MESGFCAMDRYHIAVVGAGLVGEQMVRELRRRHFPAASIKLLARSARDVTIAGERFSIAPISPEAFDGIQIAFFAGTEGEKGASVTYARDAVERGAIVVDNGSDFRMDPAVPLVVPEVNGDDALAHRGIIANPNCSTIQMVVPLAALRRGVGVRKVVVSTYQAVSGAGRGGVTELDGQLAAAAAGRPPAPPSVFPSVILGNVIPQIGAFDDAGFCTEETKMLLETRKILHDPHLRVVPTTVRVPVPNGHAESVYVELDRPVTAHEARSLFAAFPGLRVIDGPARGANGLPYPIPADATGSADILVGRIRAGLDGDPSLSFWIVADNILKGAATNAIQIAEWLIAHRPAPAVR